MLDLTGLRDYGNWIGLTAQDVYRSVLAVGGWQHVFPGPLPVWASRIRQYFNLNPMTLRLLDQRHSSAQLDMAQTALPDADRAKYRPRQMQARLQSRGMGITAYAPGSSGRPGTPLAGPDPRDLVDYGFVDRFGTYLALSGDVYADDLGRSIWFQMGPGATVYHFEEKPDSPTWAAVKQTAKGQARTPLFKLISLDHTGGSRESCILNTSGTDTIGEVNETVSVYDRFIKDSVNQGSYNFAETIQRGLPSHQRLDVHTDPCRTGYFVEPSNLFQFAVLDSRRFPATDRYGISLALLTQNATTG